MNHCDCLLKYSKPIVREVAGASAGAGLTALGVTPTRYDVMWLVWHAYGYHTAGADRECGWQYLDPATTAIMWGAYTLPTTQALSPFYSPEAPTGAIYHGLIPCTNTRYLRFYITALGAAENFALRAFAFEVPMGYGV